MSNLRLVCVGRINPLQDEIISDPEWRDTWHDGVADATAADDHAEDTAEYISWMDEVEWLRRGC